MKIDIEKITTSRQSSIGLFRSISLFFYISTRLIYYINLLQEDNARNRKFQVKFQK